MRDSGIEVLAWRDEIVKVLGWNEGGLWEREGRPASSVSESPAERRFTGELPIGPDVRAVLDLAANEAAANGTTWGPTHVVVAPLLVRTRGLTGRFTAATP